jgi:DNA invertase Pin-like site-specific DNA recombinase
MTINKRAAIYARVSTDDKEQNPETQLIHCREYCRNAGYDIIGEYVDKARAKDYKRRRRWAEMLAEGRQHRYDIVVSLRLDRPFRTVRECANTLNDWLDAGIKFRSVQQDIIDTSTSSGRFITWILAAAAELESSWIGERVAAGMARAKAEGRPIGRKRLAAKRGLDITTIVQTLRTSPSISAAARTLKCSRRHVTRQCRTAGIDAAAEAGRFMAIVGPGKKCHKPRREVV